jgi:hypothetical protein
MADGQIEGNSAVAVAEPVQGQSVPAAAPTPSQNGQASGQEQSAPAEDSFSSIDLKTLSPELQAVYKSMQADYTKKLQPVAELRKKAEAFDKVASRSDFKDWWSGASKQQKADYRDQKADAEKSLGEKITDEEFAKGFTDKGTFLSLQERMIKEVMAKSQKEIEELKQYKSVNEASNIVESFATEKGKDGNLVRPDFYKLDEDRLISGFLSVNPPENNTQEGYVARLNEAYGWAKQVSQKYYEQGKAEALQIIQKKAGTSTELPTQAAKGAYTGPNPKGMSVRDAMELAKKGIRVPRDD